MLQIDILKNTDYVDLYRAYQIVKRPLP